MYSIKIQADFSGAHNLVNYKGKCEELHGHNWKVEVEAAGSGLDKTGMLLDFKELKMELNEILEELDHKYLNDLPYFKKINPTSENIAKFIYDKLKAKIPATKIGGSPPQKLAGSPRLVESAKNYGGKNAKLKMVNVWETDTSSASYYED